jgi:hypothetical protein
LNLLQEVKAAADPAKDFVVDLARLPATTAKRSAWGKSKGKLQPTDQKSRFHPTTQALQNLEVVLPDRLGGKNANASNSGHGR